MAKPETHTLKFCNMIATVKYTGEGLEVDTQGDTKWDTATVRIRPARGAVHEFDTLIHESLHLILDDCDSCSDISTDDKEKVILEVAPRLVVLLRHAWVQEKLAKLEAIG